jgi:SecD/SecF fusion protein
MQGKGIVRFFLILLTVVCLLQYLYLLPTRKIEKAADAHATAASASITDEAAKSMAFKMARANYLDSMSSEPVMNIPLLGKFSYEKLKRQQIALGLDLKGGISTVLQVDLREFLVNLSNRTTEPAFKQALDNADLALKSAQSDYITLFGQEWKKVANGAQLAPIFSRNATLREQINFETSDDEVLNILRTKANETVQLTYQRLKDRIDKLGVVQPNVSLDNARDLILVELPGIDNPERARSYLQSTAKLEFWDVYQVTDAAIMQAFVTADARLKKVMDGDTSFQAQDSTIAMVKDTIWTPTMDTLGNIIDSTMSIVDVPADSMAAGETGPLLAQLNLNYFNGQSIQYLQPVMGVANRNKINSINEMLAHPQVKNIFPQDVKFMWASKPFVNADGEETDQYELYAIRTKRGSDVAPLEGDRIVAATSSPDPMTGQVTVNLRMDNLGGKIWAEMTTKAAQDNNRSIAIALDDEVVSAPRVNEAITTGSSRISGNFSIQEGQDLANILEIGKLPAKTTIIQDALVGPSLGKENIQKSLITMIVSMILVILFMIFYYSGAGVVAVIALLANLFFIFGALSSLGTVLTLPGIAGIVLTIGMAVDANVIIYERAREELRAGKSLKNAVADGFKHSYSAIIDANVTTILVALVLAYFGLGPIKGFAITLLIGVIFSFFTAVIVGRLIIEWWIGKGNTIGFWNNSTKNIFSNFNVDWLGKRKIAYICSGVFILIGLVSMFTRGFELGVDFKGGYSYNVEFADDQRVEAEQLRNALTTSFGSTPIVKSIDAFNTYNVTTSYLIDDNSAEAQTQVTDKLFEGVNAVAGGNLNKDNFIQTDFSGTHIQSSAKVGPTIADDIKKSSFLAGGLSLLLIFVYILIRFNRWQFSLGAVLALLHDALVVLSAFSLLRGFLPFSMEVDQVFIAALLTVIGYSINDTVVIFDRIRENFALYGNKTKNEILNLSINQTMSRTIITALTVFLVVVALLIFGGASIKGFAFAMVIGLISGSYSTIYIAAPILADLTGEIKTSSSTLHSYKKTASAK